MNSGSVQRSLIAILVILTAPITQFGNAQAETPGERYVRCSNTHFIPIARNLGLPLNARLTKAQKVQLNDAVEKKCKHFLSQAPTGSTQLSATDSKGRTWLPGEWYGGYKNVIIRLVLRADKSADINFLVDRKNAGGGKATWKVVGHQLLISRNGVDLKFKIDFEKQNISNENMTLYKESAAQKPRDKKAGKGRVNGDIPEFRACVEQNGHRLQSWSIPRAVKWCCDRIGGEFYSSGGPLAGECRK